MLFLEGVQRIESPSESGVKRIKQISQTKKPNEPKPKGGDRWGQKYASKAAILRNRNSIIQNRKLEGTRFSNSGFCHLGVNFFVFCRNLKTKTDLKSLCNFQIECGISKDLMIKFLPKIKKMLFFSVFDLIFLRVFSFFSVKNMSFLVWDHSRL